MLNFIKVISTIITAAKERKVKFLRFGKSDVQDVIQAGPYGTDSHPIKDMVAVYGTTDEKGKNVVIGYLNKNALAAVGEHRTFSTDSTGAVKFFIYQKNDGTCEIGGNADFMVRFNKLKTGFDLLKTELNAFVTIFNAHVHPGVTAGGASTLVSITPGVPAAATIDDSKIDEIKTI